MKSQTYKYLKSRSLKNNKDKIMRIVCSRKVYFSWMDNPKVLCSDIHYTEKHIEVLELFENEKISEIVLDFSLDSLNTLKIKDLVKHIQTSKKNKHIKIFAHNFERNKETIGFLSKMKIIPLIS